MKKNPFKYIHENFQIISEIINPIEIMKNNNQKIMMKLTAPEINHILIDPYKTENKLINHNSNEINRIDNQIHEKLLDDNKNVNKINSKYKDFK